MTADLFSLAAARQLRDEGMVRAAFGAAEWLYEARNIAEHLILKFGETSADVVMQHSPIPPKVSKNAAGSLFRDKRFKKIGYKESSKVSAHARTIAIWALNEQA